MTQCSISCELHDYIEIACMYGYQLKLTLMDHQIVEGKAIDTTTSAEKREFLVLDHGQQVELNKIKKLQVTTPNAKFTEVNF